MKRSALLLSVLMAAGSLAPVLAADKADNEGLNKAVDSSMVPARMAGLGAGLLFGTPVSIVRETTKSYISMTNALADKVGGHEFAPSVALVSVVTIPAAVVVGGAKGTYIGASNAMVHGFNQPFNQQSFSLGKMEE